MKYVIFRETRTIKKYWNEKGWSSEKKNAESYDLDKLPDSIQNGKYAKRRVGASYEYSSTCFLNPTAYVERA